MGRLGALLGLAAWRGSEAWSVDGHAAIAVIVGSAPGGRRPATGDPGGPSTGDRRGSVDRRPRGPLKGPRGPLKRPRVQGGTALGT